MKIKNRVFNGNVKLMLLYGCETWEVPTRTRTNKLQTFVIIGVSEEGWT
jgi:hypothetical protein